MSSINCSLWDSSSRCDSENSYCEFLRSKILDLHVVLGRVSLPMNWFFTKNSMLSSSFQVSSEISFIRIEFFVSRKRMTPDTVPSTFHWHRLCNTGRKTFSFFCFSLSSNGFPIACFLYFLSEEQNHQCKEVQNRGFKHCVNTDLSSVVVHGFREVPEIVVRIVDERRVIIDGSILVELFGLITCVERGLGQIAKQLV